MSNLLVIEPTEFKNLQDGQISLGVRVYDEYGCAYDNNWESIPENDMEIFEKVMECDNLADIVNGYFNSNACNDVPLMIGMTRYTKHQMGIS